jgi:hypothetical protein
MDSDDNSEAEDPSDVVGLTMQEFNEFFDLMLKNMSDTKAYSCFNNIR